VAYQAPCHLRAQNMGHKTRDVLQLIPGTQVSVVERCTAMDGTWAMKKEFYPLARRAAQEMEASRPDTYATDCSMSALQIQEVRGEKPRHPISLVREAYGLPEER
jgi:Fe-S oxidoreductase